jgi:hypothetical protein
MNKISLSAPAEFQKKTFFEYYGMDDWKLAFPVGLMIAFPLYQSEVNTHYFYFIYFVVEV